MSNPPQNIVSVSLCDESMRIRGEMNNFSRWVRERCIEWETTTKRTHTNVIGEGFMRWCNPFHRKGLCPLCWPKGAPTRFDWMRYVAAHNAGYGSEHDKPASISREQVGTEKTDNETEKKSQSDAWGRVGWILAFILLFI